MGFLKEAGSLLWLAVVLLLAMVFVVVGLPFSILGGGGATALGPICLFLIHSCYCFVGVVEGPMIAPSELRLLGWLLLVVGVTLLAVGFTLTVEPSTVQDLAL